MKALALAAALIAAQFAPDQEGREVTLQNRILCESPEAILAFFEFALHMEGQGIIRALVAANHAGIRCGIGGGPVIYRGAQAPFESETPHGVLRVTVHEFETPDGPVFGWTTDAAGGG